MASLFHTPIQTLKGVGEKRAPLFGKIGAPTVGALLRLYPRAYEDWSHPFPIAMAPMQVPCPIRATVVSPPRETRIRKGMLLTKTVVSDGAHDMEVTFFNNPYIPNLLREGQEYLFYGKLSGTLTRREMTVPEFAPAESAPAVRPIYKQTEGLSSRIISQAVRQALLLLPDPLEDPLPDPLRQSYGLCHLRFALENIHFPQTMQALETARSRLVFEELLFLQMGLLQLKQRSRRETSSHAIADHREGFYALLPFPLTGAQKRAIDQSLADMTGQASPWPMSRLIQGDVGSGKTAVAAALCYCVARSGKQSALMAPTEILARQHFQSLSALLAPAGISVGLLTGSLPAAKRRAILEQVEDGRIQILVGTHALLGEGVSFSDLALVVTDEQHRFGVAQRSALAGKGNNPHLLVMSATPIPRTLALMIYGDLDVSILDELPPGRQKVDTYAISSRKRDRAFGFLRRHIEQGYQCYIVCPLVEEGQNDLASVEGYAARLREEYFPTVEIGILHGKMRPKEKERVMERFSQGEISILVSTTVVEVGVNVPNAAVILIENAERYGLSQLHQLRGRVGRGTVKSSCILVSDAQNEEALARLRVMCQTNDGFQIAEEDLRLRGPGDFFGTNQHGLPNLKIAGMASNMETLRKAQEAARSILRQDPSLSRPEHRGLRAQIRQLFAQAGENGFN